MRQHQKSLEKLAEVNRSSSAKPHTTRGHERLYSSGGTLEKIMRNTYQEGLAKLNGNCFSSKQDKEEWQRFVDELSPDELAMVSDSQWK
jgi:hypothetical protein